MEISPTAGLLLIESHTNEVKKHQSMIDQGTMNMFLGRMLQVYVANLAAKTIFFPVSIFVAYAKKARD